MFLPQGTQEFIRKARLKHGERYDYSRSSLIGNFSQHVTIICPIHGEFQQRARYHVAGQGCKECQMDVQRISRDEFLHAARERHGDKYDYSAIGRFTSKKSRIELVCPVHGPFSQTVSDHMYRTGCARCGRIAGGKKHRVTPEQFVTRAREVHGDSYDYSNVAPSGWENDVIIVCKKHGPFNQLMSNHLKGCGCPRCVGTISRAEKEISDYIVGLGIADVQTTVRGILDTREELDIYLHQQKVAFEYCGLYWHSEKYRTRMYHKNKRDACEKKGLTLYQIFEHEWISKQSIVESRIASVLGIYGVRHAARELKLARVLPEVERAFFDKNHLQGYVRSSVCYGLFAGDELISAMSFGKARWNKIYDYEMLRLATKLHTQVVGGPQRLLAAFKKEQAGKSLVTYADLRWGSGAVYQKLGFTFIHDAAPNYWYFKTQSRVESRVKYQKHKLAGILKIFDPAKSEKDNMKANGFLRIYDCGNAVFAMK